MWGGGNHGRWQQPRVVAHRYNRCILPLTGIRELQADRNGATGILRKAAAGTLRRALCGDGVGGGLAA